MFNNVYTGVVEDRDDPQQINRVRVRVFGIHTESKSLIPTEDLPWATVMLPTTCSGTSGVGTTPHGLVEGSWVILFFTDPDTLQDPIVIGSIASKATKRDGDVGFKDPDDIYPTSDYVDESDVNKHARGEITKLVDIKNYSKSGWGTATGGVVVEPESPYSPVYPLNKVYESESGHVFEIDDTPDAERIHEFHRSGTFYEVHPDGTKVTRIVGSNYEVIAGTNHVYIKGGCDVTVDKDAELYIKGDWNIRVDGNVTWYVGGSMNHTIENNHNVFVNGSFNNVVKLNSAREIGLNHSENVKGNINETVGGNFTQFVNGYIDRDAIGVITEDGKTINLNNGINGAARINDDTLDNDNEKNGNDQGKIVTGSATVFIGG